MGDGSCDTVVCVQVLESEILSRSGEELQMEFKHLVRKLRPAQLFPLALLYRVHPTMDILRTIFERMWNC